MPEPLRNPPHVLVEIQLTVPPTQPFPGNRVQILVKPRHRAPGFDLEATLTRIGWFEPVAGQEYHLWRKMVNHPTPYWPPDRTVSLGPFKLYPIERPVEGGTLCLSCGTCWPHSVREGVVVPGLHPPVATCAVPRWRALGSPYLAWVCLSCLTGYEVPTWLRPMAVETLGCPGCNQHEFLPLCYLPAHRIEQVCATFDRQGRVCPRCEDLVVTDHGAGGCPQHPGVTLITGGDLFWLTNAGILQMHHDVLGLEQVDRDVFAPSRRAVFKEPLFARLDRLVKLPKEQTCSCMPAIPTSGLPDRYDPSVEFTCSTCHGVQVTATLAYHLAYREEGTQP